jgi:hypothetical protein
VPVEKPSTASKTKDQIIADLRKDVQRLKREIKRERVYEGDLINRWRIDPSKLPAIGT